MTRRLTLIPPVMCAVLISLSAASSNSIKVFKSETQSIQPTSQIAFVKREQQGDSLLLIDPTTRTQKLIAQYSNARIVGIPLWSLDCKFILVDQIGSDNKKYITRVDIETNPDSQNIIPSQLNLTAYFPKWSPDGEKLVFQAVDFSEGLRNPDIYTLDITTHDLVNITNSEEPDAGPSWSPDGKKIIFSSIRNGRSNIYETDTTGTNTQVIYTDPNFNSHSPLFSPDGKSIVFVSSSEELGFLKLLTEDKSIADLLSEPKNTAAYYTWSPDGQYIAISSTRPNENALLNLITMKTREIREIVRGGMREVILFSWSPDSSQIVFKSNQTSNSEIYMVAINSGTITQLTKNDHDNLFPSWSPPSCIEG